MFPSSSCPPPRSAAALLPAVRRRPGGVRAGHSVCWTPLCPGQQPLLQAGRQVWLRVHPGPGGPRGPHLHLPGGGRLRGDHGNAAVVLTAAGGAEPAPGGGVHGGGLRPVEAPLPGLLLWLAAQHPHCPAVAEGLMSSPDLDERMTTEDFKRAKNKVYRGYKSPPQQCLWNTWLVFI